MVEADKFVHVFLKEYSNSIAKNFKKFLDEDLYVDLIFIFDNKKRVKAHQMVLAYLSQFLYKILIENHFDSGGKVIYICMPDVHFHVMERIIQFLYTGQIILDTRYLKEFNEVMQLLGMPTCSYTHTNEVITASLVETNVRKELNRGDKKTDESLKLAARPRKTIISCEKGENCALALAFGENVSCAEEHVSVPTITEVKSLCKISVNGAKNQKVFSSGATNSLNNQECIKKIAKNLLIQLNRYNQSNRKIRNDRIHKHCSSNRCMSKNEKDLQERFSTRKFLKRRRCCTQQFVPQQMGLNTYA